MKVLEALQGTITQAEFAQLVGVSEARVSQMLAEGALPRGASGHSWLLAYAERLREQAAGRASAEAGGLDLVQERAGLARSQREAQEMKNQVMRGEWAPIGLLEDVLAAAAAGVVDRFEQLDGALKKAAPDLPAAARDVVHKQIADARNEWIRATASLAAASLDQLLDDGDDTALEADLFPADSDALSA